MAKRFLSGFTLIELIVVMAIVAILAGAAIVAINPGQRNADARNTKRTSHVTQIMSAIQQYAADNGGVLPAKVTNATTATCIGTQTTPTACVDLTPELVTGTGNTLSEIPMDPGGPSLTTGTAANTQYTIQYNASTKRVTISAPNAENGKTINVVQ